MYSIILLVIPNMFCETLSVRRTQFEKHSLWNADKISVSAHYNLCNKTTTDVSCVVEMATSRLPDQYNTSAPLCVMSTGQNCLSLAKVVTANISVNRMPGDCKVI
jgi:hypothetical protein